MPWCEGACLASHVLSAAATESPLRVADASQSVCLRSLLERRLRAPATEAFFGRNVVLNLPDQLQTVAALLQLDGVARRIVLWPPGRNEDSLEHAAELANGDIILDAWPLGGEPVVRSRPTVGSASRRSDRQPTEWVLTTSGTTGEPKLVVHTLASLARHIFSSTSSQHGRVWATFYDIRRYGGLQIMLRGLADGVLLLQSPRENLTAYLARLQEAGASHVLGTPTHWRNALMAGAGEKLSPSYVRLSGEIVDQAILDQLRHAFPAAVIVHAFASTEAGLAFEVADGAAGFPSSILDVPGSIALRVVDGELGVRSDRLAAGVLGSGGFQTLSLDQGFFATGDLTVSGKGRHAFTGRRDGVVNVGGQKVHPEEVEGVINRHPAVRLSCVRGQRNAIAGALVVADIVCAHPIVGEDAQMVKDEILALCRQSLEPFKVPVRIALVASIEIGPSGKLNRSVA